GAAPEEVVALLNRFLSLALAVVEERDGLVNKFLGDGFMALFNAPLPRPDHADRALSAALGLLERLHGLNQELVAEGQTPLRVGDPRSPARGRRRDRNGRNGADSLPGRWVNAWSSRSNTLSWIARKLLASHLRRGSQFKIASMSDSHPAAVSLTVAERQPWTTGKEPCRSLAA